jgi:hypothetical protein
LKKLKKIKFLDRYEKKIFHSILLCTFACQIPLFAGSTFEKFFKSDEIIIHPTVWQNNYFRSLAFTACKQIDNTPVADALMQSLQVWDGQNIDKLTKFILNNNKTKTYLPLTELINLTETYLIDQNNALFSFILINNSYAENLVEKTPVDELEKALISQASSLTSPEPNLNNLISRSIELLNSDSNKMLITTQDGILMSISEDEIEEAISSINVEIPLVSIENFIQSLIALGFDTLTVNLASYLYNLADLQGKTYLTISISTGDIKPLTELCNRCALHSSLNSRAIIFATVQVAFDYPLVYNFPSDYYINKFKTVNKE